MCSGGRLAHSTRARSATIDFYNQIIDATDHSDLLTSDVAVAIPRNGPGDGRRFDGILRENDERSLS